MAEQVLRLFSSASLRRKGPGRPRYTGNPPSEPEFEMMKPLSDAKGMATAAVVITITEASPTRYTHEIIQEPARVHLADDCSRAISPSPSNIELPPSPSDSHAETTAWADSPPILQTSPPVIDRNEGTSPTSVHSPVMRSMFPRFDPTISLQQQRYYPTVEIGHSQIPDAAMTRAEYSPRCYSPPENIPMLKSGYVQSNTIKKPKSISTIPPPPEPQPEFSSPSDLLDLWSLANGQGLESPASTYTLQLECTSLTPSTESIHLLSSLSTPLYSLTASPTTHTITRTHPTAPHPTPLTIAQPALLPLGPSQPLLASIFPAMAELMALDQSSTVAVTYKLDRATSGELQAEALVRAKAREGCNLFWDDDSGKYYLVHPTLDNGDPMTFTFAVEHDARTRELSRIQILVPAATGPLSSSSTTTQQAALLTLSLRSLSLSLNAPLIAALPSLYILDSLLSALLTLLLHLHRSASNTPLPHPSPRSPPSHRHDSLLSTTTTMTFAPPPTRPTTAKTNSHRARKSLFATPRRSTAISTTDTETATDAHAHTDVELAALPAFKPSFAHNDSRLPRRTRVALRLLYGAFGALVWVLGALVNLVAAGVVGVGRL